MNALVQDQDREAIHSWLLTIKHLTKQAPRMIIIPGHAPLSEAEISRGFHEAGKP